MIVEFKSEYRHRASPAEIKVYPAGWKGEVDAEIAKVARKAGAVATQPKEKAQPAKTRAEPKAKVTPVKTPAKTPAKAPVKVAKDKS